MVAGAVGVVAGFSPIVGFVAAVLVFYALIQLSERPAALGRGHRGTWAWGIPIAALVIFTVALAIWSAWHGLFDHPVLPPPVAGSSG